MLNRSHGAVEDSEDESFALPGWNVWWGDSERETRLHQAAALAYGGKVVSSDELHRRSADGHEIIVMDERSSEISQ